MWAVINPTIAPPLTLTFSNYHFPPGPQIYTTSKTLSAIWDNLAKTNVCTDALVSFSCNFMSPNSIPSLWSFHDPHFLIPSSQYITCKSAQSPSTSPDLTANHQSTLALLSIRSLYNLILSFIQDRTLQQLSSPFLTFLHRKTLILNSLVPLLLSRLFSTLTHGHTLDLVCFSGLSFNISDHLAINVDINIPKDKLTFRNLRSIPPLCF